MSLVTAAKHDESTPAPDAAESALNFRPARQLPSQSPPAKKKGNKVKPENERVDLLTLDREFINAAYSRGELKAFDAYLGDEARLHRNGLFPLTTGDAVRAFLSRKTYIMQGVPMKSEVAQSNDLGYTYGHYEVRESSAPSPRPAVEKGYYVRIWKRDATGRWKIALDTTNPLPPEEKK
ncbi:MAG: YybH family protein [Pyrinomonadaceae bacterium]